jgi:PHS family inorganic phosphate transporter-like MFS transporter
MLAAVFAMQGIGILIGGLVFVITLRCMQSPILFDWQNLDYVWRIALGFGAIPGLIAVYFRLTIPETPRYTVDVVGDAEKAERDVEKVLMLNERRDLTTSWKSATANDTIQTTNSSNNNNNNNFSNDHINNSNITRNNINTTTNNTTRHKRRDVIKPIKRNTASDFRNYFSQWRNLKILLGTAYCWFALDIAWYGIQLNQSTILSLINYNGPAKDPMANVVPPTPIWETLYQRAVGNIIIACAG